MVARGTFLLSKVAQLTKWLATTVLDDKSWNGPTSEIVDRDYLGIFGTLSMVNKEVFDPIVVVKISRVLENMRSDASLTPMGSYRA